MTIRYSVVNKEGDTSVTLVKDGTEYSFSDLYENNVASAILVGCHYCNSLLGDVVTAKLHNKEVTVPFLDSIDVGSDIPKVLVNRARLVAEHLLWSTRLESTVLVEKSLLEQMSISRVETITKEVKLGLNVNQFTKEELQLMRIHYHIVAENLNIPMPEPAQALYKKIMYLIDAEESKP